MLLLLKSKEGTIQRCYQVKVEVGMVRVCAHKHSSFLQAKTSVGQTKQVVGEGGCAALQPCKFSLSLSSQNSYWIAVRKSWDL